MSRRTGSAVFGLIGALLSQCVIASSNRPVIIEEYGDSTTYGWAKINGVYSQVQRPASAVLGSMLRAKFGPSVTVVNRGVNGSTAGNLLNGDGMNKPWKQQMKQSSANVIILNYGINDSRIESKESVAKFKEIESELVRIAQESGKQVVIATSNPVNFAPCKALPDYAAASADVARSLSLSLVDQYRYWSAMDWVSLTSDGAHPSQAGYEAKARREYDVIEPIVAKLAR